MPWWDKIGVNTSMNFKESQSWHHPAMTDEEIEDLVERMPSDLELAGLSPSERDQYLRARFSTLQTEIARARSTRKRSPHTFDPVAYNAHWDPTALPLEPIVHRPIDSALGPSRMYPISDQVKMLQDANHEQESLPPQPYGPRLAPPPLPEVSFWSKRPDLQRLAMKADLEKQKVQVMAEKLSQKESDLERDAPWLSSNESVRVEAEKKLRSDPKSSQKISDSLTRARLLRMERWELLEAHNKSHRAAVQAQGGHERLAWHQFTDEEWRTMSDVEFAYWRHEIAQEWIKENPLALKDHDLNHAGTITIALRRGLADWQRALYEYEKALSPAQLSTDESAVWHYELRKTAWYKAGQALEARLVDVERRSVLHRRHTVLNYLCQSFNDWANYYTTALENTLILEQWGLKIVSQRETAGLTPEAAREQEKLKYAWKTNVSIILQELQRQKQAGPFPFDTSLEKIDQHVIDKIYAHIVLEEEQQRVKKESHLFSADLDLPPVPLELKAILSNAPTMLVSSGDSAESGLIGSKLVTQRANEVKLGMTGTIKEMDRRYSLMLMYWRDHGMKEVEIDGKAHLIPETDEKDSEKVPYEVIERCYFNLLDDGIDVHGLYEKPQWEVDEAGRYRMSSLSPLTTPPPAPITAEYLEAAGHTAALDLFNDLVQLVYPVRSPNSVSESESDYEDLTTTANWTHLGLMDPIKPRQQKLLQRVMKRGHPSVVKAENEAAFYSTTSEVIDPHPHLWQRLLNISWRMNKPPTWLIPKLPDMLGHWRGVSDQDLDVTLSADETTGNLHDPRTISLNNPQRKAWELEKRRKEYKSLVLGDKLTDKSSHARERLLKSIVELSVALIPQKPSLLVDSTEEAAATPKESVDSDSKISSQTDKFLQLRRDLIREEEINAARWASEFNFKNFCKSSSHLSMAILTSSRDVEMLGTRFTDGFLMTVREYVQPASSVKRFDSALMAQLRLEAEPQEVLDLETELFHRRQRIQAAHARGLPRASSALMMYYYHAYALRMRIDLLRKSAPAKVSLASWATRYLSPSDPDSPFPRTLSAALYQLVTLPFQLVRYFSFGALPFTKPSPLASITTATKNEGHNSMNAKDQSQKLVQLARHLDKMSQVQPWKMWTFEPWTWRTTLASSTARELDSAQYLASMNPPRSQFWEEQQAIWNDYVDSILGLAHQLAVEQRISQGISSDKKGTIDGTGAHKEYLKGEKLLTDGKFREALKVLTNAARLGSTEALFSLGKLHSSEVYPKISGALPEAERLTQPALEQKSRSYLNGAVLNGHIEAITRLVQQCSSPPAGARTDISLAVSALRVAVEQYNMTEAKFALAILYERSGQTTNMRYAIDLYKEIGTPLALGRVPAIEMSLTKKNPSQSAAFLDGRL